MNLVLRAIPFENLVVMTNACSLITLYSNESLANLLLIVPTIGLICECNLGR